MSLRAALPRTASPSLRLLRAPQAYSTNLHRPTPPASIPSSSTSSLLLRPSLQQPHRRSLSSSPPLLAPPPTPADDGLLPEERRRKRREELMKEEAEKNQRRNTEQTLRLEEILEAGPGNPQYDRIQGDDRALPFPQELFYNPPPVWKAPAFRRIPTWFQVAQAYGLAIYGTDSNGSYLTSARLMLPYFLSSDKVKDTEKEVIASATQSLTQYLQTKTHCNYTQLHYYATPPALTEAVSFARRLSSPERRQFKLVVNVTEAKMISLLAQPIFRESPTHGVGNALIRFTYSMTLSRPNAPDQTKTKTGNYLFERRSWAKDPSIWKFRREIDETERDLEVAHEVPIELLQNHMDPSEWRGVKKIAGKPIEEKRI